MKKHLFFLLSFFLVLIITNQAYTTQFTYYNNSITLSPVAPPVIFTTAGTLGPNKTSATTSIALSNTAQLITNPDFYANPDYWYCSPGTYLSCYYLTSDIGASGGVGQIYGTIPTYTTDQAYLIQSITFPQATITSITMSATLRYVSRPLFSTYYYIFGLYDPVSNSWVSYTYGIPTRTYTTYTLTINPSSVSAGRTYYVVAGGYISTISRSGVYDLRYDSVYLTITTAEYVFSGVVLGVNNTDVKSYFAKLVLQGVGGVLGDLSANVTLENLNGVVSSPISIVSGSVVLNETSEVAVPQGISGYNSLWVRVNAKTTQVISGSLYILFVYCSVSGGGGVCEYYPITLNLSS